MRKAELPSTKDGVAGAVASTPSDMTCVMFSRSLGLIFREKHRNRKGFGARPGPASQD